MAISNNMSFQTWMPNGFPSVVKAFATLTPKEQDSFQSFSEKQKNSLKEITATLAKHDSEAANAATVEEKQAALNADLKTQVEAFETYNAKLKSTHNKQEAVQSLFNTFSTNYTRNLNATPEGRSYYQKAEQQQQQKAKENLALIQHTFEKTAKLVAPNATPEESQAWIAAGDKAVRHDAYQFALQGAFQNPHENKGSVQVAINSHIANAFIANLLLSSEGRNILQKAIENSSNPQSQTASFK
jgi:hypothetical protein